MTDQPDFPPLRLSVDPRLQDITACPFGTPPDRLDRVPTTVANLELLTDAYGRPSGFVLENHEDFALDRDDPVLWTQPRHLIPVLDPCPLPIGQLLLAARACFGTTGTPDVTFAVDARAHERGGDPEGALECWRGSLAAGNLAAHRDIGRLLLDLNQPREARGHLFHSIRLDPTGDLGWLLLGAACRACDDLEEARRAYVTAGRLSLDARTRFRAQEQLSLLGPSTRLWEEDWWRNS